MLRNEASQPKKKVEILRVAQNDNGVGTRYSLCHAEHSRSISTLERMKTLTYAHYRDIMQKNILLIKQGKT